MRTIGVLTSGTKVLLVLGNKNPNKPFASGRSNPGAEEETHE